MVLIPLPAPTPTPISHALRVSRAQTVKLENKSQWCVFRPFFHVQLLTVFVFKIFRRRPLRRAIRGSNLPPLTCSSPCGYDDPSNPAQILVRNRGSKKTIFGSLILTCRSFLVHIFVKSIQDLVHSHAAFCNSAHHRVCPLFSMS